MRPFAAAVFAAAVFAFVPPPAYAGDAKQQASIKIEAPWARPTPGRAKNGAAFMTLVNTGETADSLVSATSDAADRTEVHAHIMDGGVMRMRKVDGVEVVPGSPTVLKPGGLHLMFLGLKKPLKIGETVAVTLTFAKAGKVEVRIPVANAAAGGAPEKGGHDRKHKGS